MTKKRITITLSEDDYIILQHMHNVRYPIDSKGNPVKKFTKSDYIRNLVYSDYKNWDKE